MSSTDDLTLAPILEIARTELDGAAPDDVQLEGRRRLLATLGSQPRRAPRTRLAWMLAAAAMLAIAAFFFAGRLRPEAPIGFAIDGAPAAMAPGGAPITAGDHDVLVAFDDGSRVSFRSGSSGRIAETTARGARIVVGEGRSHFDVWHRPGTSWAVEAGRYVIRVTGTAFDVEWSPSRGALRVAMQRGSVVVEGAGQAISLTAGQELDIDGTNPPVVRPVSALRAASAASPPTDSASASVAPPPVGDADAKDASPEPEAKIASMPPPSAANVDPSHPRESWPELVRHGHYDTVVSEARSLGVKNAISSVSLADLEALAEAARYQREPEIAREALDALRARFPQSQAAHMASFLLGRIAEDSDGAPGHAIELYDEYLATGGPFAAEALGRKMIAVDRAQGAEAAKPIARDYVAHYPDGSYAGAARRILDGSP